jgi:hypothetical protein
MIIEFSDATYPFVKAKYLCLRTSTAYGAPWVARCVLGSFFTVFARTALHPGRVCRVLNVLRGTSLFLRREGYHHSNPFASY